MDGWTDGRMDGQTDGWAEGQMDGRTDEPMDQWTKTWLIESQSARLKMIKNKAGYTATSCGRLGRGGNARFPTFQLECDGPTDGRTKPLIELRVRN